MKTPKQWLWSLVLFFAALPLGVSQPQTAGKIFLPTRDFLFYQEAKVGNTLMFVTDRSNRPGQIWRLDLATGQVRGLSEPLPYLESSRFNSQGVFFISYTYESGGDTGFHTLHFADTALEVFSVSAINDSTSPGRYRPRHACIAGDRYYVNGFWEGQPCVWESDGTAAGTQIVFRSDADIRTLIPVGDRLLIVTETDTHLTWYRYQNGETEALWQPDFTQISSTYWVPLGTDGTRAYVGLKAVDGPYQVWFADLSNREAGLLLSGIWVERLLVDGEGKYLAVQPSTTLGSRQLWLGNRFDTLPPRPLRLLVSDTTTSILRPVTDRLFQCIGTTFGMEWVWRNEADSLVLLDLLPGPGTSYNCERQNFDCALERGSPAVGPDGAVYALASNQRDTLNYVHRLDGQGAQALFPRSMSQDFLRPFVEDSVLYWTDRDWDTVRVMRYDLRQPPYEPQPAPRAGTDTWHRQLATVWRSPFYFNNPSSQYPLLAQIDAEGDITLGFAILRGIFDHFVFGEGWDVPYRPAGDLVFAQYDQWGNPRWVTSLGDYGSLNYFESMATVDPWGDIVVFSTFEEQAFFGADTLRVPRAGHFLAKLDGATGAIKWQKNLARTHFIHDIRVDRHIATDEDGNIYLPFAYHPFALDFDGQLLTSNLSPMIALASFSPEGALRWARNTETPWTDYYGLTRVFAYDTATQRLAMVQSQGFYNTISSCAFRDWHYFVQYLDREGTLLDTFHITGSDLGGAVTGTFTKGGRLSVLGYHRGTLDYGLFQQDSPRPSLNACHETEGFWFEHDSERGDISFASGMAGFLPISTRAYRGHLYHLGTIANRLVFLKYTQSGHFVGYKRLQQIADVSDYGGTNIAFDVRDGYLVVLGKNFRMDKATGVVSTLMTPQTLDLLRLADAGWQTDLDSFAPIVIDPEIDQPAVRVFPNPFSHYLRLVMNAQASVFDRYELLTLTGQVVQTGSLNTDLVQEIRVANHANGLYLLRLLGGGKSLSVKVLKR